ncbi:hypothetical protein TRIUR3_31158 [Triticum urartu]|uniref:Uncharacterized protein n=1 Tax=Triticum urartu TaxID=4572 RepID=M7ZL32_TRIUA|nr:hypothetical protein TRIUR3_31158 [Triticum urartu]
MRSGAGAGGVPVFFPASSCNCWAILPLLDVVVAVVATNITGLLGMMTSKVNKVARITTAPRKETSSLQRINQRRNLKNWRKLQLKMKNLLHYKLKLRYDQVTTKRIEKENSSTNLQNTLLQRSSPNKTQGGRLIIISPNALIQDATKNSQMFEAMDPKN